jgi:hypothetical protein
LYAEILAELRFLSKGDVLLKMPADFLGVNSGETASKTKAILEKARYWLHIY